VLPFDLETFTRADALMKLYVTYTSPYARLARILVIEKALEDRVEIIEAKTRTLADHPAAAAFAAHVLNGSVANDPKRALPHVAQTLPQHLGDRPAASRYEYKSSGAAVIVVCPTSIKYPSGSRM
jgi:hypothetical protein